MGLVCTTCSKRLPGEGDSNDETSKSLYEYFEMKRNKINEEKNLRKQSKQSAVLESAAIYWINRGNMTVSEEHRPIISYKIKNLDSLIRKKNLIVTAEVFFFKFV